MKPGNAATAFSARKARTMDDVGWGQRDGRATTGVSGGVWSGINNRPHRAGASQGAPTVPQVVSSINPEGIAVTNDRVIANAEELP
jgi:hypothetical protein